MRFFHLLSACLAGMLLLAGCASDGSIKNPFASSESFPTGSYYFSEFPDIPIPNDMGESKNDTVITIASSGAKYGVQRFTGRVEPVSLMNAMRRNMADNGWTLRSLLRSKESVLIFEKPDRMAVLHINDGLVFTEMRIFVSSRLDGDSGSVDISAYSVGTTSSGGGQKLSQ